MRVRAHRCACSYGLAIHTRIYPLALAPAIAWWLCERGSRPGVAAPLFTRQTWRFGVITAVSAGALCALSYAACVPTACARAAHAR